MKELHLDNTCTMGIHVEDRPWLWYWYQSHTESLQAHMGYLSNLVIVSVKIRPKVALHVVMQDRRAMPYSE